MNTPPVENWTAAKTPAQRLLRAYLNHPSPHTIRAYTIDLATLGRFLGKRTPTATAAAILALEPARGNEMGEEYAKWLRMNNCSPATVWRRIASLKALVKRARRLGLLFWTIDTHPPSPRPIRDTRGPGRDGFSALLANCERDPKAKGRRDLALLRLLHDLALRAAEVLNLELEHVDLRARRISIMGKGRLERQWMDLPIETVEVLAHWLAIRGPQPGPLWTSFQSAAKGAALCYDGLRDMLGARARKCGFKCTPHGLRHLAITSALEATQGDIRSVQQFSRHSSAQMVCRYDDARKSHAAEVANLVASNAGPAGPGRASRNGQNHCGTASY